MSTKQINRWIGSKPGIKLLSIKNIWSSAFFLVWTGPVLVGVLDWTDPRRSSPHLYLVTTFLENCKIRKKYLLQQLHSCRTIQYQDSCHRNRQKQRNKETGRLQPQTDPCRNQRNELSWLLLRLHAVHPKEQGHLKQKKVYKEYANLFLDYL